MRTVGEILKNKRLKLNLTLEEIEAATKIKKIFLESLENNDFKKISSEVVCRGFIKNYAEFLDLPAEPILAIFKRDYIFQKKAGPRFIEPSFQWTPKLTLIASIIIAGLLIAIYLGQQYLSLMNTPYR